MPFRPVEGILCGQGPFDFLTERLNSLGDFLVKFTHRAKMDVKLPALSSSHPVHGGKVGEHGNKPRTEIGSGLRQGFCPDKKTALTFHTTQPEIHDVWFCLRNFCHLRAKTTAEGTACLNTGAHGFVSNLTHWVSLSRKRYDCMKGVRI